MSDRSRSFLHGLLVGASCTLAVCLAVSFLLFRQLAEANRQRHEAERQQWEADKARELERQQALEERLAAVRREAEQVRYAQALQAAQQALLDDRPERDLKRKD